MNCWDEEKQSHPGDWNTDQGCNDQPYLVESDHLFISPNAANLGRRSRTQHLLVLRLSILVSVQRRRLLHYRQLRDRG